MYIAQAFRFKHDFWRYLLGFIVVFIGSQFVGAFPLGIAIVVKMAQGATVTGTGDWAVASLFEPNVFLLLLLIPFVVGMLFLLGWLRWVHGQPFRTLHSITQKLDWKKIAFSFGVWAGLTVVLVGLDYMGSPQDYVINFKPIPFLIMALIAILFIPIQAGFEEYMFRGYLMQGIGVVAKNRWAPLFGTSVLFGVMHLFNPEVDKIGYVVLVAYIGAGLFLGILTLMNEGLELAIGFHVANNLITALLVTSDWTIFQTHSVLKSVSEPSVMQEVIIPVLVMYPILIFLFAKKYKWTGWREKLFGKVQPPADAPPST